MANLSNVVNVSIIPQGRSLSRTNMNIVTIFTSESGALSSNNRTIAYTDLSSVAEDFGTSSSMYEYAKVLFAQTKNPTNSGGYLVAGYWRASDETVLATAGKLSGSQVNEATIIPTLQTISDGSFEEADINVPCIQVSGLGMYIDYQGRVKFCGATKKDIFIVDALTSTPDTILEKYWEANSNYSCNDCTARYI